MDHRRYLELALEEALAAREEGEDPIGCVIVDQRGLVIARAHNVINQEADPTAHAEMLALRAVIPEMQGGPARGWTIYATLEPCPMCLGTIVMCEIGRVVWGASDRRKETHKLLSANAYMRSRLLTTIASPFADLEKRCSALHDDYWIRKGRPKVIRRIHE